MRQNVVLDEGTRGDTSQACRDGDNQDRGLRSKRIAAKCEYCGIEYQKRADRVRSPDFCCLEHRKRHALIVRAVTRGTWCDNCGEVFIPRQFQLSTGQGRYCSNSCAMWHCIIPAAHTDEANDKRAEARKASGYTPPKGEDNPKYRGTGISPDGYRWNIVGGIRVFEHRQVMSDHLGRPLSTKEVVHHINRDRLDNRIENLQIMTRAEHMNEHRDDIVSGRGDMP